MKTKLSIVKPVTGRLSRKSGFTLVEILMTVAILSTLGALAHITTVSLTKSGDNMKLSGDVAVLNKALRQYEMFGGNLTGVTDPQAVINKLKTKLTGDDRKQMAGLKGGMVDTRLRVELQSTAEAATPAQRARYRTDTRQFELVSAGAVGIKKFMLDDALANVNYGTEARSNPLKLAKTEKWVWDFNNSEATRDTPSLPPNGSGYAGQPTASDPANPTLDPPEFNLASGTYPLLDFPVSVTITDSNTGGISELQYNSDSGPFQQYVSSLSLDPGVIVAAFAAPLDPDRFEPSSTVLRDYRAVPETPILLLQFTGLNVDYAGMGGAMMPTNAPGPPLEGQLEMSNANQIPDVYESSTVFEPRWTMDGSDPLTSPTSVISPGFSNGYPGNDVPVLLAEWADADATKKIRAVVKTLRPSIVNNSAIKEVTLTRQVKTLRKPSILFADHDCTLTLDIASGEIPTGARIYYTTNDTDPGDNLGEPVSGTLYTGPFLLSGVFGQEITVTARTYPPSAYKAWFRTSLREAADYELPAATSIYVGGDFQQNVPGDALRNIARLGSTGAVDYRFNTGSGAAANSIVGVIRQLGPGVLAGGDFESVNGVNQAGLVRLQLNGAVDPAFNAGLAGQ